MAAYAPTTPESAESTTSATGFLTRDEVMTAREVAELLRMPTSTVYELAPGRACFPPAGSAARGGSCDRA